MYVMGILRGNLVNVHYVIKDIKPLVDYVGTCADIRVRKLMQSVYKLRNIEVRNRGVRNIGVRTEG